MARLKEQKGHKIRIQKCFSTRRRAKKAQNALQEVLEHVSLQAEQGNVAG